MNHQRIAHLVGGALSARGQLTSVEPGARITWPLHSGLLSLVGLSGPSRSDELVVAIGVLDEATERVAQLVTEAERANLSPGDVVRGAQLSQRLATLAPTPLEWRRDARSAERLSEDIWRYGLPFVQVQSTDTLIDFWEQRLSASWPDEGAALTYFSFLVSRAEFEKAVRVYERFIAAAERPGTKRLARARLERARALGFLDRKP